MKELICPNLANYFFGDQFRADVVNQTLLEYPDLSKLLNELAKATRKGEIHKGLRIITYLDVDTGLFVSALQRMPDQASMISFFASSNHRFFGGQTLVCVPFQFCTKSIGLEGDYLVYRHTFKKPTYSADEIDDTYKNGTDEERANAMIFTKSRDGYETIPGMSYVGMTKRSWQERYIEHTEKALKNTGSTLFHRAVREMQGKPVIHVHDVSAFGLTREEAIKYEKKLIESSTLYPKGLNMKVG